MRRKKLAHIFTALFISFLAYISSSVPVQAQCPVCVVTVGGGVMLSRYLGIDDLIIGMWSGAFILAFSLWTASLIKKVFFKGQQWVLTVLLWIASVWGLKIAKFIGNPQNKIFSQDKLLVGIFAGTIVFMIAFGIDLILRKLNIKEPGKALFPYQRVILPVSLLIIGTISFLLLLKAGIK